MRLALKLAIVAAEKSQRQIAAETRVLSENRLSDIVRGWVTPRDDEKTALARVLRQPVSRLFKQQRRPKAQRATRVQAERTPSSTDEPSAV
jgi:hypothetical protein